MSRYLETAIFFVAALAVLLAHLPGIPDKDGSLYLAVIEDPAARLSLYPWDAQVSRQLGNGHLPLWNPYSGTGMPLGGNLQSAPLQPLKWPFYFFPDIRLLDLAILARLALLGAFTFLLCRECGLSRQGAAMAGLCMMLSGYAFKHVNMVSMWSESLVPLLLYLAARAKRTGPDLAGLVAGMIAWSLVLAGGNPEAAFYAALAVAIFGAATGVGRSGAAGHFLAVLLAPLLLGGLLASCQLLAFADYLGSGWHIHDPQLHLVARHPARYFFSLIAPWLGGPQGSHDAQLVSAPYIGAVTFFLALIAFLHLRRLDRRLVYFALATPLFLALVYHLFPVSLLTRIPPFNMSGNVKFAMFHATLATAVLAGTGLDFTIKNRLNRRLLPPALAAVSIVLLGGALYTRQIMDGLYRPGLLIPFVFLAGSAIVMVAGQMKNRGQGRSVSRLLRLGPPAALLLIVLSSTELLCEARGFRPRVEISAEMMKPVDPMVPPPLDTIAGDPELPRFIGMDGAAHHNFNLLFDLHDLRAFEGIYPERYVETMGVIEGFGMNEAVENFFSHGWSFDVAAKNLGHPLLDLLGVKYAVSEAPLSAPGFEEVSANGYRLYQNREAFPRAFVDGDPDFSRTRILEYGPDLVTMESRGPGTLVLTDTFFPGWRAYENGAELAIRPWRGIGRSLEMGPGPRRLTMVYEPVGFRIGLWASLTTAILTGAFLTTVFVKKYARR